VVLFEVAIIAILDFAFGRKVDDLMEGWAGVLGSLVPICIGTRVG
jgi:hypothetical protein